MRIRNALAIVPLLAVPALLAQACLSGTCEDASKECPSGPFRAADPNAKTGGNGAIGGGSGQSGLTTGGSGVGSGDSVGGSSNTGGGAGAPAKVCDTTKLPSEEPCLIDEMYGVFVSQADGGAPDGSRAKPFATISAAVTAVRVGKKRIYVCAGPAAYNEQVALASADNGLQMFGAFTCANGWIADGNVKASVKGPASGALRMDTVANARLEGFQFESADAADGQGESSYGAFVKDSTNVVLSGVNIVVGKGGKGANGASPPAQGNKATSGFPGLGSCASTTEALGGNGGLGTCAPINVAGGRGGNAGSSAAPSGGSGVNGEPVALLGEPASGEPGIGEAQTSWTCATVGLGNRGADGLPGMIGPAGALGHLASTGLFLPGDGITGGPGTSGKGGGGGGGSKVVATCTNPTKLGASGGGGGAGGCGGEGGKPGGGGGASIALVSYNSKLTLRGVDLDARNGGQGGTGSAGQDGSMGGSGGPGGGKYDGGKAACDGGDGGVGGKGGSGGGGTGGSSIGIAYTGTAPSKLMNVTFAIPATQAPGGAGGGLDNAGADGDKAEEKQFI